MGGEGRSGSGMISFLSSTEIGCHMVLTILQVSSCGCVLIPLAATDSDIEHSWIINDISLSSLSNPPQLPSCQPGKVVLSPHSRQSTRIDVYMTDPINSASSPTASASYANPTIPPAKRERMTASLSSACCEQDLGDHNKLREEGEMLCSRERDCARLALREGYDASQAS